jgi:two-component system phosphate regulon sensor histidine kinase PhoR
MRKKRLLWQLYPSYLLITLIALLVAPLYATGALRRFYYDQAAADLESRARLLEEQISEELAFHPEQVDSLCDR